MRVPGAADAGPASATMTDVHACVFGDDLDAVALAFDALVHTRATIALDEDGGGDVSEAGNGACRAET